MAQTFGPAGSSSSTTAASINKAAGIGDPKNIDTNIRVHTAQAQADHGLSPAGAKAYAQGNDIHFGAGDKSRLIAHELTHVVQQ